MKEQNITEDGKARGWSNIYFKDLDLPPSFEKLHLRQIVFTLALAEGKSAGQATKEAYEYVHPELVEAFGARMLKEPGIEEALADLMASGE